MIEFLFVLMFVAAIVWISVNAFRPSRDPAAATTTPLVGDGPVYQEGQPSYMYDAGTAGASSSFDAPADAGCVDTGGSADAGSCDSGDGGSQ